MKAESEDSPHLLAGGEASAHIQGQQAFGQPIPGLTEKQMNAFFHGNSLFKQACNSAHSGGSPEISRDHLLNVITYIKTLAVPVTRLSSPKSYADGRDLFAKANCNGCHTPQWKTGTSADFPKLSNQTIYPYTDILLHDMGELLSDNRTDFEASGNEWRTPPLWGLGLLQTVNKHQNLLHDGRARGVEEAILWHGGEAENSLSIFKNYTIEQRKVLINFVNSL